MVHPIVFTLATGMGLFTDKYELSVTNFVDHLAHAEASEFEKDCVKSAMYVGAIFGMLTFGPLSDYVGRRVCMIGCSLLCFLGAAGSTISQSEFTLISCRIITGIGMGGEYPLAASHSAESATDNSNASRNVGLLYLFGSGVGQALCPLVVYVLLSCNMSDEQVWRGTFLVGAVLALVGLVLRVLTTQDSDKFKEASAQRDKAGRSTWAALRVCAKPLCGTALAWFMYDIIEYGLKQNDAAIFSASTDDYKASVMTVFLTRILVIPSQLVAAYLPKFMCIKWAQLIGFAGCAAVNLILALGYPELHSSKTMIKTMFFDTLYIVQLSFQSFLGVTTMAIPAEIFPSAFKGTAHGISAAMGKVGATVGSYSFSTLNHKGYMQSIFAIVTAVSILATIVTMALTPLYNGNTLDQVEELAQSGDTARAVKTLYSGPLSKKRNIDSLDSEDSDSDDSDDEESSD